MNIFLFLKNLISQLSSLKWKTYSKIIDCLFLDQDQDQEERKVQDQEANPTPGADQGNKKNPIHGCYENVNESL